jgi:hypothetical protein
VCLAENDGCDLDFKLCDFKFVVHNNNLNRYALSDIDECARNLFSCHASAGCVNTDGSYNCVCNNGYSGDGITCDGKLK